MADIRFPEINRMILSGHLCSDPELRYTPSGTAVCSMRLASNRSYKDTTTGEYKQETAFVTVVAWTKLAEVCGERLKKGAPLLAEGRIRTRSWKDNKTGQDRRVLEVHADTVQFLEKRSDDQDGETTEKDTETEKDAVAF